jgi:hypothetical protein
MAQTSYSIGHNPKMLGSIADLNSIEVEACIAEGNLPFGIGVVQGTTDRQAKLAVAGGLPLGVVVRAQGNPNDQAEDVLTGNEIGVLRKGRVTVEITGTVTKEAPAYMIVTVGATQGKFTATAGSNLLAGKFAESVTGAGLAIVNLNL